MNDNRKEMLWLTVLAVLRHVAPLLVAVTLGLLLDAGLLEGAVLEGLVQHLRALCVSRSLQCSLLPSLAPI